MKQQKVKYTTIRSNTYWLHLKLPQKIFSLDNFQSQLIRQSLQTKDPLKAEKLSSLINYDIKSLINSIPAEEVTPLKVNQILSKYLDSAHPKTKRFKPLQLNQAYSAYAKEAELGKRWRVQTEYDNDISNALLISIVGNILVSELDHSVCRKYRDGLIKQPTSKVRKDTLNSPTLSVTTINNHIRRTSTFFNWLVDQGFTKSNPLSKMKLKQSQSLKSCRDSFSTSDLIKIYSNEIYTNLNYRNPYQYWVPLLALYTGARLEELCQLRVSDIQFSDTVNFIKIDDKHEDQNIKSQSSRRQIPLHNDLLKLGFKQYVLQQQESKKLRLFDTLRAQRNKYGHQVSRWFSRFKAKVEIIDKRKVFHSYRHTMVDTLRKLKTPDYEIKSILGHSSGSITYDIYGSELTDIHSLNDTIQKIDNAELLTFIKPWASN